MRNNYDIGRFVNYLVSRCLVTSQWSPLGKNTAKLEIDDNNLKVKLIVNDLTIPPRTTRSIDVTAEDSIDQCLQITLGRCFN